MKRYLKSFAVVLLVFASIFSLASCQSTKAEAPVSAPAAAEPAQVTAQAAVAEPAQTPVSEPVQTPVAQPVQTAVAEPVQTAVAQPVQTAAAEPIQTPVAKEVRTFDFELGGYKASAVVKSGEVDIKYPAIVDQDDIVGFARYISANYPMYTKFVSFEFLSGNHLLITYPAEVDDNIGYWLNVASYGYQEYVDYLEAQSEAKITVAKAVAEAAAARTAAIEAQAAAMKAAAEAEAAKAAQAAAEAEAKQWSTYKVVFGGLTLDARVKSGYAEVVIPAGVTAADIRGFADYVTKNYGSTVSGLTYAIKGNLIVLNFPKSADPYIDQWIPRAGNAIVEYIDYINTDYYHLNYKGIAFDATVKPGFADIEIPASVTEDDIIGFVSFAKANYPQYFEGVSYFVKDGHLYLNYPKTADGKIEYFLTLAETGISEYLRDLSAKAAAAALARKVAFEKAKALAEETNAKIAAEVLARKTAVEQAAAEVAAANAKAVAEALAKQAALDQAAAEVAAMNAKTVAEVAAANAKAAAAQAAAKVAAENAKAAAEAEAEAKSWTNYKVSFGGLTLNARVKSGYAEVVVPAGVTAADISGFADYVTKNYGSAVSGLTYAIKGNLIILNFPKSADPYIDQWIPRAGDAIVEYIDYINTDYYHLNYKGVAFDATVKPGFADIEIPASVTEDDIIGFVSFAKANYPQYLKGVSYYVNDGHLYLNYPKEADGRVGYFLTLAEAGIGEYIRDLDAKAAAAALARKAAYEKEKALAEEANAKVAAELLIRQAVIEKAAAEVAAANAKAVAEALAKQAVIEKAAADVAAANAKAVAAQAAAEVVAENAKAAAVAAAAAAKAAVEAETKLWSNYKIISDGVVIDVRMKAGYIDITYPSYVTADNIFGYLDYVSAKNGDYLKGLSVDLSKPYHLILTYPESVVVDVNEWLPLLKSSIEGYIEELNTKYYSFFFGDNVFYASVKSGRADIQYPSTVSADAIKGFIGYVNRKYGKAVEGLNYEFQDENHLILTYPASADANFDSLLEAGMFCATEYVQDCIRKAAAEAFARKVAFEKAKAEAEAANAKAAAEALAKKIELEKAKLAAEKAAAEKAAAEKAAAEKAAAIAAALAEARSYSYYKVVINGAVIPVRVKSGFADFTLPAGITAKDIDGFAAYAAKNYGSHIEDGLKYEVKDGHLLLNYSSEFDDYVQSLSLAAKIVSEYIDFINTDFYHLNFRGVEFDAAVKSGFADITIPADISADDINGFAKFISAKYPQNLKDVSYQIKDGHLYLTYPKEADAKIGYFLTLAQAGVGEYIRNIAAKAAAAAQARKEAFEKAKAEAEAANEKAAALALARQIALEKAKAAAEAAAAAKAAAEAEARLWTNYKVVYGGVTLSVRVKSGHAEVAIPSKVTADDINGFASYVTKNYGSYVSGLTYEIKGNVLVLDYPKEADANIDKWIPRIGYAIAEYIDFINTDFYHLNFRGVEFDAAVKSGFADITIPAGVTADSINGFVSFVRAKYPQYVNGVKYLVKDGHLYLTYPKEADGKVEYFLTLAQAGVSEYIRDLAAKAAAAAQARKEAFEKAKAEAEAANAKAAAEAEARLWTNYKVVYGDITLSVRVKSGHAEVAIPSKVTADDINGFASYVTENYGSYVSGLTYEIKGNVLVLDYPKEADAYVDKWIPRIGHLIAEYVDFINTDFYSIVFNGAQCYAAVKSGIADMTIPAGITADDINGFVSFVRAKYPQYVKGVKYLVSNGHLVLTYPKEADGKFEYWMSLANFALGEYIKDINAKAAAEAQARKEAFEKAKAEAEAANAAAAAKAAAEAAALADPVKNIEFVIGDLKFSGAFKQTSADVTLPARVDADRLKGFTAYVQRNFGPVFEGITYSLKDGHLILTYPPQSDQSFEAYFYFTLNAAAQYFNAVQGGENRAIVKSNSGEKEFDIYFVHTNDVHGRIVPQDGGMGYAKFAGLLGLARQATDKILVLDAGDALHGTNIANFFKGQTVMDIMGIIGYDCFTPGNHEFNYKPDQTAKILQYLADSGVKVLSYNITDGNGNPYLQRYQVYDFNGFRVAVFGLSTPDTYTKADPRNLTGIFFDNEKMISGFQKFVDMLHTQADYVVCLGHVGMDDTGESGITSDMVCSVIDGINLFIDGHSHTYLSKPVEVNGTYIVQTGEYLKNVGVEKLHIKNGKVTGFDYQLISADDVKNPAESKLLKAYGIKEVPEDEMVSRYIALAQSNLNDYYNQVVAEIPEDLNGERAYVRSVQTNLGALVCEAMTTTTGADFTIMNGGNIRKSLSAGPITIGDINEVLPFENSVVVAEMKGSDIYAAFENGYKSLPALNGAYPQSELEVVYNKFAKPGKRILKVLLNGKPIDKNKVYQVATNDYLAAGGDGYTQFGKIVRSYGLMNEVLINYLTGNYPVHEPTAEDEIIVKTDDGQESFDLYFVHTNDVHGRIVPQDGGMGYAKFAGLLGLARQATDKILVLDAGDALHGTNLVNFFKGQTVIDIMGLIGYDCFTLGNHEFNYKPDQNAKILQYLADTGVKVLSYNITDGDGNPYMQRYQIYDFDGFKVAVFGYTTPDTYTKADPRNLDGIFFDNQKMLDGFQSFVNMLHKKADYVVCLGHVGLEDTGDSGVTSAGICQNINGIDLFIDGHSHTALEEALEINGSYIVQTGEYLKNFGVEKLHIENGKVTGFEYHLISAEDVNNPAESELLKAYGVREVPEDPDVAAYIDYMKDNLSKYLDQVVAVIPTDLDGERAHVRTIQTDLGALVCEAMTNSTGADFTIMNGGNIRKSLKAGPITVGDITEVLPFANLVVVAEMKGSDIYSALENGYKSLPAQSGGYPQSELEVVYNKFARPGKRILKVLLNGEMIDKNKVYQVATNDYLAAGGDEYSQFGKIVRSYGLMNELFLSYLSKKYPAK